MNIHKSKKRIAMVSASMFFAQALCLTFAFATSQRQTAGSAEQSSGSTREEILQRITAASVAPTRIENREGAPILILSSGVKEISNVEYRGLVGKVTPSQSVVSFPEVRIQNTSGQKIRAFALLLKNRQTNSMHFFKTTGIDVGPDDQYEVLAERWIRPETLPSAGQKGRQAHLSDMLQDPAQRAAFWSSEKMWMIGNAGDIDVRVGFAEFADGTRWSMPTETSLVKESGAHLFRTVAYRRASLLKGVMAVPAVSRLPSCVYSCGEYCWSQGVCDCSGDCNDCTEFSSCTSCMNNCCVAARTQCGRHGGILS